MAAEFPEQEPDGRCIAAVLDQPQKLHLRVVERLQRTIFAVITHLTPKNEEAAPSWGGLSDSFR